MSARYLQLYDTGELTRRAELLHRRLADCDICPRHCHVNRLAGEKGYCRAGMPASVASVCAHRGEEPPISGKRGSGTIFFNHCNLRCCFCQNFQISQPVSSTENDNLTDSGLAAKMLFLQDELGCHNINLVSPAHYLPQILAALIEAIPQGLDLPLVYNSSGYEDVETLKLLDGIVDIYLPDIRYSESGPAKKYSGAANYPETARLAITEMYRQVGLLELNQRGIARRGIIVRHLILPGDLAGSEASLRWLAEHISPEIAISIMSQYHPCHEAHRYPELSRAITSEEYEMVRRLLDTLGLENGWLQEMGAAEHYLPDFDGRQHPFE